MTFFKKQYSLGVAIAVFTISIGIAPNLLAVMTDEDKDFIVTDAMKAESRYVIQSLEKTHYNKKPISELDSSQFINSYLNDLDSNHLFLKQPQVDQFHIHFDKTMVTFLKQGNIYPAFEIFKVFKNDFRARITWVLERLEKPFDFSSKDTYTPSRKDLPFPANDEEANQLWEKRLKFELLSELLSDPVETKDKKIDSKQPENKTKLDEIKNTENDKENFEKKKSTPTFEEELNAAILNVRKRYERISESINEIDPQEVQEIFLTSLAEMYDPHSSYYSSDTLAEFSMLLTNSLVGIGATLSLEDGYCTIKELIAGGPAERSKQLKPNDKILAVAQGEKEFVDVIGMKLRKTVRLIRGEKGTVVRLLIRPADGSPTDKKIVSLTRDEIRLTSNLSEAKLYEIKRNDKIFKIGVIEIPSFYAPSDSNSKEPSVTRDVEELVGKLQKLGMDGLILDLRYNGGGLLPEAITLTGLFIPIGPVVHVRNAEGQIREYIDTNPDITWKGPLVILTSKFSASASEIFAGALKDYHRAIIIGDTSTHGKGTVQLLNEISKPITLSLWSKSTPKMGATKFTVQKWYLPDGSSTQLRGVPSDIVIPSVNEYLPIAEADLPNALAWDAIHTIPWTDEGIGKYTDSVNPEILNNIREMSLNRQNSLEEFSFLKGTIEHFKKNHDQKEFSLNLETRKSERKNDNEFTKKMEAWLDKLSTQKFEAQDIKLDATSIKTESPTPVASLNSEEPGASKTTLAKFDIYKREALRVMSDYIEIQQQEDPTKFQNEISK